MAVNVGYSIGWGYPVDNSVLCRAFSTVYILLGSSAVAVSLGYFAQSMIASSKNWYAEALEREKYYEDASSVKKIKFWINSNAVKLEVIFLWVLWIIAMTVFSCVTIKWDVGQGIYFAVSSLSTGGCWPIPNNSPNWYFGLGM